MGISWRPRAAGRGGVASWRAEMGHVGEGEGSLGSPTGSSTMSSPVRWMFSRGGLLGVILFAAFLALVLGACDNKLVAQTKPAPDRNGSASGNGDNLSCPPGPDDRTKGAPDGRLGDTDLDKDGNNDYFMGEWKYVKAGKNIIVKKWCINAPESGGAFRDFFTFEILTSKDSTETVRVTPGHPT